MRMCRYSALLCSYFSKSKFFKIDRASNATIPWLFGCVSHSLQPVTKKNYFLFTTTVHNNNYLCTQRIWAQEKCCSGFSGHRWSSNLPSFLWRRRCFRRPSLCRSHFCRFLRSLWKCWPDFCSSWLRQAQELCTSFRLKKSWMFAP